MAKGTESCLTQMGCFIELLGQLVGVRQEEAVTLTLLLYLTQGHMCPSTDVSTTQKNRAWGQE